MENNGFTSDEKTVLITGASRGIGKAIAYAFAKDGYRLILTCSKTLPELQEVAADLEKSFGISCRAVCCDMSKPEVVANLFASISSLDVLVNNAGVSSIGLLHEMSVEEWHRVLSVNLDSLFLTCKHAIPLFLKHHSGSIVNISSVWGNVGASMEVAYSASKGGVNAFTKALAKELAPSGIPVNAIACGVIDTSMNHCFTQEELDSLQSEIPADRLGTPEEVAQLVLMTSKSPAYMTGQILTIDGGWY